MVRLTDRPDMTLDVYSGRKTTIQQQQQSFPPFLQREATVVVTFCFAYLDDGAHPVNCYSLRKEYPNVLKKIICYGSFSV